MQRRKTYGRILTAFLIFTLLTQFLVSCQLNSLIRGDIPADGTTTAEKNDETESKNDETEENDPNAGEIPSLPSFFSSLTGLETKEAYEKNRPLCFVIGNSEAGLPQYGIGQGEVIVEVPVEDGSTKLLCITTSYAEADKIGSIRAASPYYRDIAGFFSAVLIHSGSTDGYTGNEPTGGDILSAAVQGSGFYKETNRVSPHNIFTTSTRLLNAIRIAGYSTTLREALPYFRFKKDGNALLLSGTEATHIRIDYSSSHRTEFRYQSADGLYKRYQNGMVQSDAETGAPLTAKNVFILYCNSTLTEDANGASLSLTIDSGSGVYATDGAYIPILWYKNSEGGLVFIRESDGALLEQNAGVSYIEFVKSSQKSEVVLDCN